MSDYQKIQPPALPPVSTGEKFSNVLRLFFNRLVNTTNLIVDGLTDSSGLGDGSKLVLSDLPTADPLVAGQIWNDSGTLKVSSG